MNSANIFPVFDGEGKEQYLDGLAFSYGSLMSTQFGDLLKEFSRGRFFLRGSQAFPGMDL
jgi:hypothetical protein